MGKTHSKLTKQEKYLLSPSLNRLLSTVQSKWRFGLLIRTLLESFFALHHTSFINWNNYLFPTKFLHFCQINKKTKSSIFKIRYFFTFSPII
ncbi:hypothetical protein ELZ30_15160 [Enterococcus faecium]|nr:hypothetical protein DPR13_12740 [Enterococcus faecium]RIX95266.1 hypothetical protein D3Y30_04055 [Enterococcus faecium TX1330]EGP5107857.1 hypothetical protein [Enterococcus faecium]EGP5109272.1 hypothetical protein [Enterococcus faecium]EGP5147781.1 hypothetical protein [Enterococcus faecium]